MGFVSGGLLATVLLLVSLSALEMACLMLALHATAVAFVSPRYRTVVLAGILILTVLFAGGVIRRLDAVSQAASWRGYHIIESRDSVYGNIQLLEKDGAESLFENGLHVATTGDALSSEESVHYALLASPSPKRLLLIGGGLAGSIREALKYSGLHVDYVELDPAAIDIVRRNIPDAAGAMMDTRVRIIAGDGRRFVKNSDGIYDVIIVNLSDPLTLLVNRYYTEEFFREARRHLSPRGILALGVTSSENYLNKEGWIYLRTLRRTLGMVFAEVRSIPGDRHIFLASSASGTVSLDASVIAGRLKERDIRTRYVREYFFNVRLDPVRIAEAEQGLLGKASVNTDSRPSAFLSALVFWSTHFRSGFSRAVDGVKTAGAVVLLLPVVVALVSVIFRRRRLVASGAIVGAAGFCFMVCQLAVMMAFQSFYGYVYAGIGLVTAAGMAGMFAGSSWGGRVHPMDVASRLQRATVFAAVFVVAFGILLPLVSGAKNEGVVVVSLVACSVLAGFFGGAQFALSTRCAGAETAGGVLYSVDVLGAAVGAVVGGIFFIPLWGITATACFCGLMQAAVLLAFIR
jgi:spermidine synthase